MKRPGLWFMFAAALLVAVVWWMRPGREEVAGAVVDEAASARAGAVLRRAPAEAPALTLRFGALAGRVRDPSGRPIAGAQVCAAPQGTGAPAADVWPPTCGASGRDGAYRLEGLLPARHEVRASAPRYLPARHVYADDPTVTRPVYVRAGAELREVDMVLRPGGVELRGTVRDAAGGEVEGALLSTADGANAISAADGSFSLWVAPGEVALRGVAEGYAPITSYLLAPGQRADLYLMPEAVLVGQVVRAEDGLPLAGALVSPEQHNQNGAYTDEAGNFRVAQLAPGEYKAMATDEGHVGWMETSVILGVGETSAPVTIRAHRSATVAGRVVFEDGGVCEVGSVTLKETTTRYQARAQIEADGEVQIRGVLPGTYAPEVWCERAVEKDRYPEVVVGEASVTGLTWSVGRGRVIRGRVVDGRGEPAGDCDVRLTREGSPGGRGGWCDASGRFAMFGMKPGRYFVEASGARGQPTAGGVWVELTEERDVEGIELALAAGGEVRGRVVDAAGRPVARVFVALKSSERVGGGAGTADDGSFSVIDAPPGRYRAVVERDGHVLRAPGTGRDAPPGAPVTVALGEVTTLTLTVEASEGRISGEVVDSDGGPLADAIVDYARESDAPGAGRPSLHGAWRWGGRPVLSDAEGRFEISELSPGTYTLKASRRGGGEGSVEHVAVGSTVRVAIAETGELGGAVRVAGGGSPERFTIFLEAPEQSVFRAEVFFRTGGRFVFSGLPPGTYSVRAQSSEGDGRATATLKTGEALRSVELVLEPRVRVRGRVVDLETGAAVPDVMVHIGESGRGMWIEPGHTDAEGRFEIAGAPTGMMSLMLFPTHRDAGHDLTSKRVRLEGTGTVDVGTIELVRKRIAAGQKPGDLGFTPVASPPGVEPEERRVIVAAVRPGGPAAAAGLQVGDEITAVDGRSVVGRDHDRYPALTAVRSGTAVNLTLARGATLTVTAGAAR